MVSQFILNNPNQTTQQMSEKGTFKPISSIPNDFKLRRPTRGAEKSLHAHVVKWPGHSLEERKFICDSEGWTPEHTIPELNKDVRMEVSAIRAMLKRLEGKPEELEEELGALVERFSEETKIEAITADEYWAGLCDLLFHNLPDQWSTDDLDFHEIRRGYNDFFEG